MKISKIVGFNLWMATSFLVVFFLFKNMGAVATTGTWNGIPDLGFTEWLTGGSGGSTFNNPNRATGLTNYTQDQSFQVPQVGQPTTTLDVNKTINSGGAVLGASTQNTGGNQITQQQMSSNYSFGNPSNPDLSNPVKQTDYQNYLNSQKANQSNPNADYNNQMLNLIDQNQNDLLGGLTPSYNNQINMANQWGQQSTNDLNANVQSNVGDLNKQIGTVEQGQVKSLKDVADNIRNLMQSGNTYLGARGAGDSSAVNQYAYGLTKLGSQQRGDVMAQTKDQIGKINDNIAKVNLVATQEKQKIDYEVGQKTQEIAQWFADQQTQIKSAANKDKQALATNLYNQAVSQLAQLQNYAQSRQAQVESWALSNSTSAKVSEILANTKFLCSCVRFFNSGFNFLA